MRPVVMGEKRVVDAERLSDESPLLRLFRREGGSRLARSLAFFWMPLALACLLLYAVLTNDRASTFVSEQATSLVNGVISRPEFALTELRVTGRREASADAVQAAIGLTRGASSLAFDPALAKARLEQNPWIESAQVTIEAPGTVVVTLSEREPGAVWQVNGEFWIIDRSGDRIIALDSPSDRQDLPYLVGPGADRAIGEALTMLAGAPDPLARRIGALTRVSERRWDVEMVEGLRILLPEDEPSAALRRFAQIDSRDGVLDRQIVQFDMRLPGEPPLARIEEGAAAFRIRLLEERLSGADRNP